MTRLDLELSARSIEALRHLARAHYGDDSEASVGRVVEAALALRLEWRAVAGEPAERTGEPVLEWPDEAASQLGTTESVPEWLFQGR